MPAIIFGNGLAQGIDRQSGTVQVIFGQTFQFIDHIFGLQIQGLFNSASCGQNTHGTGAGHSEETPLGGALHFFQHIRRDSQIDAQFVAATADPHSGSTGSHTAPQVARREDMPPETAVGRDERIGFCLL